MRNLTRLSLIAAATLTAAVASAALTEVHPPAYPNASTFTQGVSGDGLTLVGYSNIGGGEKAFKLVGTSLTALSPLSFNPNSVALAASTNGSLVVGYSVDSSNYHHAVSWSSPSANALDVGSAYITSEATALSSTGGNSGGGVIVGWGFSNSNFVDEAFFDLGSGLTTFNAAFVGAPYSSWASVQSRATGISANGNLIVGNASDDFSMPGSMVGFIYNRGTSTLTTVDAAANVTAFGNAFLSLTRLTAISGDGTVAIGHASSSLFPSSDEQAFKYTLAGGAYAALGTLGGNWSKANAISSDGGVIVGQSENIPGDGEAFVYQNGTMTGLGFFQGGNVSSATGVSADGSVIVGYSNASNGYVRSFVYANQTMLDADEWMRSLNGPGSLVAMTANLNLLTLEGAHHRPLMSYDNMGKQSQAWATGDFGTSSRQVDQNKTSGEIGVSGTFGGFVLGAAAGHATLNQDLLFGGTAHIKGDFLLAEADYRLADKESIVSLVLLHGIWDADASRGYVTGGGTDHSTGSTDLKTTSVRVRFDGPTQKFLGPVSASPFASFTLTRTTADAYQETGGSFPASFDAQAHTAKESRLGLTTKYVVSPSTTLLFTAEWIHRFDDAGDGLTGTSLTTSSAFAAAGVAPTKDQGRFGLDVDHKLSADTLLSLSLHAAGNGPSADLAAALSIRRAF